MGDQTGTGGRPGSTIRDDVIETIQRCLHYAGTIDGRTEITDLAHDSIDLVELISVVSDRYGIRFDLLELDTVRSVDDLVAHVEERRGEAAPPDPLDRL